jgi:hypothetical protein
MSRYFGFLPQVEPRSSQNPFQLDFASPRAVQRVKLRRCRNPVRFVSRCHPQVQQDRPVGHQDAGDMSTITIYLGEKEMGPVSHQREKNARVTCASETPGSNWGER